MQGVGFEPTRISPSELESLALTTWLSLLYVLYSIFGFDGVFLHLGFLVALFRASAPTGNRTQVNRLEGDYSTIELSALGAGSGNRTHEDCSNGS